MRKEIMNRSVLALDDSHPAKRFLKAFLDCKTDCVGRHHGLDGRVPIDQAWTSSTDGRVWTFSDFAYAFLSLDIDLDSFLENSPVPESDTLTLWNVPLLRLLTDECTHAARQSGNTEICELTDRVREMLRLWDEFRDFRRK